MKAGSESKKSKNKLSSFLLLQSVTIIRIPLAITFSIILLTSKDSRTTLILGFILLAAIEATDLFDGIIARRLGMVSEYGAALDPFSDSLTRLIIYWSLASKNLVIFLVPLIMAIRDITVAYSRIILTKKNLSVSAKASGKIKASVQATCSFLAILGPYYWNLIGYWSFYALSWIVLSITFLSSVEYVKDAISALRKN